MPSTSKIPLLGTGLNGLVGSKLVTDFGHRYKFDNLDVSQADRPVDITQYDQVAAVFAQSEAKYVVHFAAFTDVTKAWEQRDDKNGLAYRVNVVGTQNIVRAAAASGKHLIHISTAYVFDGDKNGLYTEEDQPHPIEWYGQTKLVAEEEVMNSSSPWTILRIDQPFRSDEHVRKDIVHRLLEGLKADNLYPQFTDHTFGPTYIDDFAKVIDWVIRSGTVGLLHASSGESWSDYEFAVKVRDTFGIQSEVKQGSLDNYLKTLSRPYQRNTATSNSKLTSQLDFKMLSVEEALKKVA